MGHGRSNEEGFRGDYPAPLDWPKIIAELTGESEESSEDKTTPPAPESGMR